VKVEFTVQVPTGVRFEAHTMQGDVQAVSLTGDVDASALSGEITISTTGAAQATTLKGSITALIGSVNWKGDRVFAAGNGSVDLQMPADANVSVVANAFHGEVTSDFPLIITNGASGMFGMAQGTLGEGGRTLRLYAGKGNVSLRQAPAGGQ
jgi:DUF4097 and DUF4098 domain-containing protein YvlB